MISSTNSRLYVAALIVVLCCVSTHSQAKEKLKVAFFGFELINTSPEPTRDAETQRIARVGELLVKMLAEFGALRGLAAFRGFDEKDRAKLENYRLQWLPDRLGARSRRGPRGLGNGAKGQQSHLE